MSSASQTTTVAALLADARAHLVRVSPEDALLAMASGTVLVDIRSESQRDAGGLVPDSVFVPRNILEWRLDPDSSYAVPELAQSGRAVILICDEGYQSSLAAATLRRFGVDATDVIGGFQAWREAGLPISR